MSVTTNYATSTARVVYDPGSIQECDLPDALSIGGYRARFPADAADEQDDTAAFLRLFTGVGLAGSVMMLYLAFFYPVNLGLVDAAELEPVAWLAYGVAPFAMLVFTTVSIGYVGAPIMRGAWVGLRTGMLNMDDLLAIAILAAYAYSVGQLVSGGHDMYFDVAAVIVAVVTAGRYFEQGAKAQATRDLTGLLEAWTPRVRVRRGRELVEAEFGELFAGDRVIVQSGETVPVDGRVTDGAGAVDEALLTGEPLPVAKKAGDAVLGGTRLVEGRLEVEVGSLTSNRAQELARILWGVQSSTAGVQGVADRIARVFVPLVLVLAATVSGWLLLGGATPAAALLAGLATLIVSCPCTFGLAIPLTTANAVSTALRQGIIFSSSDVFARAPRFNIVAIDKTGTLSSGRMQVLRVIGSSEVVAHAAAVERHSTHPIARAIATLDRSLEASRPRLHPGRGAEALVAGRHVVVGSRALFRSLGWAVPPELEHDGLGDIPTDAAVSLVGWDGHARGALITGDQPRSHWEEILHRLRIGGRRLVLVTGAERPGRYAHEVDEVHVGIPPEAKAAVVRRLRSRGRVMMVGDGSNDASALAAADLGIAFGAATPLAAEAADIVIPGDRLELIFDALSLLEQTRRRVIQNIGWALLYNAIAIPLAVSGVLNPLFAALAMASSSLLVVTNSSRFLKGFEPNRPSRVMSITWA